MRRLIAATLLLCTGVATPAFAQQGGTCTYGICQVRLTPAQLLAHAETLVRQRRFADAEPLIAALAQAPDMRLQSRFLAGYAASEQGDYAHAAETFKAILAEDPGQTRVRLELARAMLGLGQTASADRQFKIAQQDDLPPDIAAAIRGARQVIRSKRAWRFDMDLGLAPDSNINNATAAERIDVLFGDTTLPVELDGNARAKSGTGQTASVNAGLRLPVGNDDVSLLAGIDGNGTNYSGTTFDDFAVQGTAGAEWQPTDAKSLSVEGIAAQCWFGGGVASRQFGVRTGAQFGLGDTARLGIQLDTRRTTALFDPNYSGWQAGLYATAEKAVTRTMVASLGGFARRDWLKAGAYSNTELGVTAGLGGELPLGVTFGLSGSISRAVFDAPVPIFSIDPRNDWRYGARLTLGNRMIRVLGFSPQVSLSYNRNASSIPFYATDRLRLRFAVARYF